VFRSLSPPATSQLGQAAALLCVAATVEQMTVIETIADDTLVFLQVHKRIWPASQRDSLFWSHMRQVPNCNDPDGHNIWIVCNHSTDNPDFPVSSVYSQHKNYTFIKSLNNLLIYESPEIKLVAAKPWNSCSARSVYVCGGCFKALHSSSYKRIKEYGEYRCETL